MVYLTTVGEIIPCKFKMDNSMGMDCLNYLPGKLFFLKNILKPSVSANFCLPGLWKYSTQMGESVSFSLLTVKNLLQKLSDPLQMNWTSYPIHLFLPPSRPLPSGGWPELCDHISLRLKRSSIVCLKNKIIPHIPYLWYF